MTEEPTFSPRGLFHLWRKRERYLSTSFASFVVDQKTPPSILAVIKVKWKRKKQLDILCQWLRSRWLVYPQIRSNNDASLPKQEHSTWFLDTRFYFTFLNVYCVSGQHTHTHTQSFIRLKLLHKCPLVKSTSFLFYLGTPKYFYFMKGMF